MALTEVTTTFDLTDYVGSALDARRTKGWITTNVESGYLVDTAAGKVRTDDAKVTISDAGVATVTHWAPGVDGNPVTWQTTYHFDVPRNGRRDRKTLTFGPFTVTASGNVADLVEEQVAVPTATASTYATAAEESATSAASSATAASSSATAAAASEAAAEAAAATAVDVSNIDTPDALVATLVSDPVAGPETTAALSATFGRRQSTVVVAASNSANKLAADFVCDGTDDQVTINAAIASLPTSGGKVLLRAGTYNVSASIVVPRCFVTIEGEGWGFWGAYVGNPSNPFYGPATGTIGNGVTKIVATVEGIDILFLDNNGSGVNSEGRLAGVAVGSLYLVGKNSTGRGLVSANGGDYIDQLILTRIFVHKTSDGMYLDADCPYISECTIMDVASHGIVLGPVAGVAGQIHHNVIADIGGDAIKLGVGAQYVIIDSNILVRCNAGIRSTGTLDANISGNQIWGNRLGGILTDRAAIIRGNTVRQNGGNQILVQDTGTSTHAQQGIIEGNRLQAADGNAVIAAVSAPRTTIANNKVETHTAGNGIVVQASSGCIVTSNDIYNPNAGAASATGYGLYVDSTSAAVGVVTGNIVRGGFAEKLGGGGTNALPAASSTFAVANNITAA